jgi:hypothetical protein
MVTQGNIAPDFTLETDRSEKVTLSKLRGRQVVLFLPEGRHTRMEDRVQGQMIKAAAAWARGGSCGVDSPAPLRRNDAAVIHTRGAPRASSRGERPFCRGNRGGLPRTNKAPLPPLRRLGWLHGLGYAARSVPATRERRWFASLSPRWGKHFHIGSSTSPTAWSQPRFRLTPSRCSSATPSR